MSSAHDLLSAGSVLALSELGEQVSFRSIEITALVERNIVNDQSGAGPTDWDGKRYSSIQFAASYLDSDPQTGEIITDADSGSHRIQQWKRVGSDYIMTCQQV